MLWESKNLRDLTEVDVRQVIDSGLEEHIQLEYKSALYGNGDTDRKEFLQDVCMFANTIGGLILIGVSEIRDERQQPTGLPDGNAVLGVECDNTERQLRAYEARILEGIDERLAVEMHPVRCGEQYVFVIRVPSSFAKPHRVYHQGRTYFPARRERQRYEMDAREIKELVMRSASRIEEAEGMLTEEFATVPRPAVAQWPADAPLLMMAMIPIFWKDFAIDVTQREIRQAMGTLDLDNPHMAEQPGFGFKGLVLQQNRGQIQLTAQLQRNGIVSWIQQLPLRVNQGPQYAFQLGAIDIFLRKFVFWARHVYQTADVTAPFLLTVQLRTHRPLSAIYGNRVLVEEETPTIPVGDYKFPVAQLVDIVSVDAIIRPFCDQGHQAFGRVASTYFNAEGIWVGPANQ